MMTLTNTKATDTGYYSCEISDTTREEISIKELIRKKYVYFFGSYLFTLAAFINYVTR